MGNQGSSESKQIKREEPHMSTALEQVIALRTERDRLKEELEKVRNERDDTYGELQTAQAQLAAAKPAEVKWESGWSKLPKERCFGWVEHEGRIKPALFNGQPEAAWPHYVCHERGSVTNYSTTNLRGCRFALVTQVAPVEQPPAAPVEEWRELSKDEQYSGPGQVRDSDDGEWADASIIAVADDEYSFIARCENDTYPMGWKFARVRNQPTKE